MEGRHLDRSATHELTERQREVLRLIAEGRTNAEIAERLDISLDGAKYHVREILGKLGVESREEAAAAWRGRRRPSARVGRAIRGVFGFGAWRLAGAAAVICISAAAAIAFLLMRSSPVDLERAQPAGTQTVLVADPPSPTPAPTPVPIPFPDGPVTFRICDSSSWSKPGPAQMADLWHQSVGGLDELFAPPVLLSAYLLDFITLAEPYGASINKGPFMLSGRTRDEWSSTQAKCLAGTSVGDAFQEAWFIGYVPTHLEAQGGRLTVTAAAAPGTFHAFVYPDPPGPRGFTNLTSLVVEGSSGNEIFRQDGPNAVQYSPEGELLFATIVAQAPLELHISRPTSIEVYCSGELPGSTLAIREPSGAAGQRIPLPACSKPGDLEATFALALGTWTVEIEDLFPRLVFYLLPAGAVDP